MTEVCPTTITKVLLKLRGTIVSWSASKNNFSKRVCFQRTRLDPYAEVDIS